VNPSSAGGRPRRLLPDAQRALEENGIAHRVVLTTSLEHGRAEANEAASNGEVVLVMSGDGLIGQVGGDLAGTDATFGVIPGGRGNDFARAVGIPTDVSAAAALIAAAPTREIDVGEINGKRFLCIASCGFDSDANRIANEARLVRGNLVYLYAALRALAAWRPARFELTLDGTTEAFSGYSVIVANSKAYGGGMMIAPEAELDDGLLDVVSTGHVGKLRFLANLPKVFKGTHISNPEVTVRRAMEARVEADRPFAVYADGDHIADLPATVRLLPRSLRVIAPAGH
jgi:YegS/Rv2252/BmrU family lipid kinase